MNNKQNSVDWSLLLVATCRLISVSYYVCALLGASNATVTAHLNDLQLIHMAQTTVSFFISSCLYIRYTHHCCFAAQTRYALHTHTHTRVIALLHISNDLECWKCAHNRKQFNYLLLRRRRNHKILTD